MFNNREKMPWKTSKGNSTNSRHQKLFSL